MCQQSVCFKRVGARSGGRPPAWLVSRVSYRCADHRPGRGCAQLCAGRLGHGGQPAFLRVRADQRRGPRSGDRRSLSDRSASRIRGWRPLCVGCSTLVGFTLGLYPLWPDHRRSLRPHGPGGSDAARGIGRLRDLCPACAVPIDTRTILGQRRCVAPYTVNSNLCNL